MNDLEMIKLQFEKARVKYKPSNINCLFIAEAPPDELSRFFYYSNVKSNDHLFLYMMDGLYSVKKKYLDLNRPTYLKEKILRRFQEDGFYLMDLLDMPKSLYPFKDFSNAIPNLISKISTLSKDVPIIIIKANVYDLLAPRLKDLGYNVIPKRIYFPCSGQQKNFEDKFTEAMEIALLNNKPYFI